MKKEMLALLLACLCLSLAACAKTEVPAAEAPTQTQPAETPAAPAQTEETPTEETPAAEEAPALSGKVTVYMPSPAGLADKLAALFTEKTGVEVEPLDVIGIRFNQKDWYVAFYADYVSGHAVSDHNENSEVLWLDIDEALTREDVPDLTKKLIQCALHKENGFVQIPYDGTRRYGEYSFYGIPL